MADYQKFKRLTERLINANGRAVNLFFKTGSSSSDVSRPWLGVAPSDLADPITASAIAFSPEAAQAFAKKEYGTAYEFKDFNARPYRILMISPRVRPIYEDLMFAEDLGERSGVIGVHEFMPGDVSIFAFVGLKR